MTAASSAMDRFPLFIVCEDVRPEVGNKATLRGVFFGYSIVVPNKPPKDAPPEGIPLLQSLCFVLTIRSDAGQYACKAQITAPGGKQMPERDLGTTTIAFPQPQVLVVREQPFPILGWGTYSVRFQIGEASYVFEFEIIDTPITA